MPAKERVYLFNEGTGKRISDQSFATRKDARRWLRSGGFKKQNTVRFLHETWGRFSTIMDDFIYLAITREAPDMRVSTNAN